MLFVAVAAMAMQVLSNKFTTNDWIGFLFYFTANLLLLQSWLPWRDGYFSFNAVSWYLSTIAFSYCLFPYIHCGLRNSKKKIYGLACIAVILVISVAVILDIGKESFGWTTDFIKWMIYIFPVYRAGDFVVGVAAGYYFLERQESRLDNSVNLKDTGIEIGVIILMAFQIFLYENGFRHTNWTLSLFWLPVSVAIVLIFARCQGMISTKIGESRVFVWLGGISGEAFLIHQITIKAIGMGIENKILLTIVSLFLTIFAVTIWRKAQNIYKLLRNER